MWAHALSLTHTHTTQGQATGVTSAYQRVRPYCAPIHPVRSRRPGAAESRASVGRGGARRRLPSTANARERTRKCSGPWPSAKRERRGCPSVDASSPPLASRSSAAHPLPTSAVYSRASTGPNQAGELALLVSFEAEGDPRRVGGADDRRDHLGELEVGHLDRVGVRSFEEELRLIGDARGALLGGARGGGHARHGLVGGDVLGAEELGVCLGDGEIVADEA